MNNLGAWAEKLARKYLEEEGYEFREANFKTRSGEIDLIMKDGDCAVFIEVKARQSGNPIAPNDSLQQHKLRKMKTAIDAYISEYEIDDWRAELVSVTLLPNGMAQISKQEF